MPSTPSPAAPSPQIRRRQIALGLATACAAPLPWLAAPSHAQEPLLVQDEIWRDESRKRDVPMRIRWPRLDPATSAATPMVIYSHGLGGKREGGSVWGEAWAAAGFLVLHMQHQGSDGPALRSALMRGAMQETFAPAQHLARFADVRFVLDEVARRQRAASGSGQGAWVRVATSNAGMAGHSFGSGTTLGMAGRSFTGAAALDEPRLSAFIAFSPAVVGPGDQRQMLSGITRPMLTLTGTLDGDVIGNGSTPEVRAAVYGYLPAGKKAGLVLQDADHMTFGGNPASDIESRNFARAVAPRTTATLAKEELHHRVIAQVSTDWWRAHLRGDTAALARLAERPSGLSANDLWQRG